MTDRDGITGTFFWTPPSGSIPPLTVTVSSTVSAVAITTKEIVTSTTEVSKVQGVESTRLVPALETSQPQLIEPSHPITTSVSDATQTNAETRVRTQTQPPLTGADSSLPATTSSPLVTILKSFKSSPWKTSVVQTLSSPGTFATTSSITLPVGPVAATPQPEPTPTGIPHAGLTKEVIAGISSGGVVLAAAFIGLIFCIRIRSNKARSKRNGREIKKIISHPVPPIPTKRLSQDSLGGSIFPGSPNNRFSQDSKAALLARTASVGSSRSGNPGHSFSERPESYTSVFSGLQTTRDPQFPVPAKARPSVMEMAPDSPSATLRVPATTRAPRAVSSYYGSEPRGRETVGNFMGVVKKPNYGDFNPYLGENIQEEVQLQSESQYHSTYHDSQSDNLYRETDNTYLRPPRNLTDASRRSSWFSNQRFGMEDRTVANSEMSKRNSDWQFDMQPGTGSSKTNTSTLRRHLSLHGDHHHSTYPISLFNNYHGLNDIDEKIEEITSSGESEAKPRPDQFRDGEYVEGMDEKWEEQRRRIFEGSR